MDLGRELLILVSWLCFSNGTFFVDSTKAAIHLLQLFPKKRWCRPESGVGVTSQLLFGHHCGLAEAAKGTMWAHSLDVSRWLPDSGSYNARRMAESFMPAEHNAS